MLKWVIDWSEAKAYQDSIRATNNSLIWAIKMPKDYPECRVTRRGIAHIAVTDDEFMVHILREDGGEVQLLP
jgi:hypothetical protein